LHEEIVIKVAFKWEEILGITCCGDGDEPTCSCKKKIPKNKSATPNS
jgi:hypothetical protein